MVWRCNRNQAAGFYRNADLFILRRCRTEFALRSWKRRRTALPVLASKNCGKSWENGVNEAFLMNRVQRGIAHAVRDCIANPTGWKSLRPRQVCVISSQRSACQPAAAPGRNSLGNS